MKTMERKRQKEGPKDTSCTDDTVWNIIELVGKCYTERNRGVGAGVDPTRPALIG